LIQIGSKMAEKNSAQTNKQTDTTKIMVTWPWTNMWAYVTKIARGIPIYALLYSVTVPPVIWSTGNPNAGFKDALILTVDFLVNSANFDHSLPSDSLSYCGNIAAIGVIIDDDLERLSRFDRLCIKTWLFYYLANRTNDIQTKLLQTTNRMPSLLLSGSIFSDLG